MSKPLVVDLVTEADAFASMRDAWNALAIRCASPSLFLKHEWFSAAWAWRQVDADLALWTIRDETALRGVLPLVRQRGSRRRTLELLTVPDTQFADFVLPTGEAGAVSDALAAALAGRRDWDCVHLDFLQPDGAIVRELLPALSRQGLFTTWRDRGHNASVALDGRWPDYYAARSRRLKKALNWAANRLNKTGTVRIDWVRPGPSAAQPDAPPIPASMRFIAADRDQFESALANVVGISARSWKQGTGNSLDRPGPHAWLRSLASNPGSREWMSMWLLHIDDQPQAMELQLIDGAKVHALRADFASECEGISPGSHLFRQLLETLFGRGFDRYYLGPGDNAYKRSWTETGAALQRATVYNTTLGGRTRRFIDEIAKPVLRAVRDRLTAARSAAAKGREEKKIVSADGPQDRVGDDKAGDA